MNILFIIDHFRPHSGGAQTLFYTLATQHIQQGDTVHILTNKHDSSLADHEIIDNIHITRVGSGRQNWIKMYKAGLHIINTHRIDLIHTSTYSCALPAWILSKYHKIPNQIHIHEIYGSLWHSFLGYKAYLNKQFEKLIIGLLPRDHYICVSRYTLNSVRTHFNIADHKIHLQSNPVNTQFWQPYNKDQQQTIKQKKLQECKQYSPHLTNSPIIGLFYGRTGVEKGLQLYIEALPDIIKLVPNFHAVIIAPNNEPAPNLRSKRQTSHSIQQKIQDGGLQHHITWIPPVNSQTEIKERITTSDICILPSLTEGFGYAMHEVSLMNKPLITTQVGGQIETIINTNTYWMKQVTSKEIFEGIRQFLSS